MHDLYFSFSFHFPVFFVLVSYFLFFVCWLLIFFPQIKSPDVPPHSLPGEGRILYEKIHEDYEINWSVVTIPSLPGQITRKVGLRGFLGWCLLAEMIDDFFICSDGRLHCQRRLESSTPASWVSEFIANCLLSSSPRSGLLIILYGRIYTWYQVSLFSSHYFGCYLSTVHALFSERSGVLSLVMLYYTLCRAI
jgi:hypothetical protein